MVDLLPVACGRILSHVLRLNCEPLLDDEEGDHCGGLGGDPPVAPVGAVVGGLQRLEDTLDLRAKQLREKVNLTDFEEKAARQDAWVESLCERLRSFASTHDLREPPTSIRPISRRTSWWRKVRSKLPVTLEQEQR